MEVVSCKYAEKLHPYLNKEFLCPYIVVAMIILKNNYEIIQFAGKLPQITDIGVICRLIIKIMICYFIWLFLFYFRCISF